MSDRRGFSSPSDASRFDTATSRSSPSPPPHHERRRRRRHRPQRPRDHPELTLEEANGLEQPLVGAQAVLPERVVDLVGQLTRVLGELILRSLAHLGPPRISSGARPGSPGTGSRPPSRPEGTPARYSSRDSSTPQPLVGSRHQSSPL